jgi:hypothetical protein
MKRGFSTFFPLAIIALIAMHGCSRTTDEAAIRAALDDMMAAVEAKQPKRLIEYVAPTFQGPDALDRDGVRGIMAYQFVRNGNIKVFLTAVRITVNGQGATTRFNATLAGATNIGSGGLMPERLQHYEVELEWWKDKQQWSVVRANWQPVFSGQ